MAVVIFRLERGLDLKEAWGWRLKLCWGEALTCLLASTFPQVLPRRDMIDIRLPDHVLTWREGSRSAMEK